MAAGIRHGVHHYEAMDSFHPLSIFPFGVLFNEATRPTPMPDNRHCHTQPSFVRLGSLMSRPPLGCALLLLAGIVTALPLQAQQGAPPAVDPAAVLATLKDLRARQATVVGREKASVLAAINAAIADPGKTYELAQAAVESQGPNGNNAGAPATRGLEPRRRYNDPRGQNDLLRNRDFVNGLRLELIYLSLTWQHQSGAKTADLINPLLDYTAQVLPNADTLGAFEPFHRGVGETVFATYFQVAPFLAGMTGWADRPFDVEGIYQQTILPEMRLEKDPRVLTYWDSRIQSDGARAEASQNSLLINKFRNIRLPALLWNRAEDEIAIGHQNQGITDMLALIKAHADHPDFEKWATRLQALVSPPPAAPPAPSPAAAQ
jgi:hypothetical protein